MGTYYDIAHWRSRVFASLLSYVVGLGTLVAVPSIGLSIQEGIWPVALLDGAALGWVIALWRLPRLPYTFRVLNFLAILYLVGIGLMLTIGPVSQIFLMALPVLGVVLLGMRPALVALLFSGASIFALGLAGYAKLYVANLDEHAFLPCLIVTLNYLFVGALITLTCGGLLQRLNNSMQQLGKTADSLEAGHARLHELNAELRLTSAAVARLNDMVLIARVVDAEGAEQPIIFANDAFVRRTGYAREEIVGRSMRVLHGPDTDPAELARILDAMRRGHAVTAELLNYTKHGEKYWVEMELVPFAGEGGRNTHWVVVGRDITERRNAAQAIHRLAFYDVLTGLPNRRLLIERLDAMVARAHAGGGLGAVLFIDLDNFKTINDARGHAIGDLMLKHAAARVAGVLRQGDTVARLGGDEFVVLLESLGRDAERAVGAARLVAEKIRAALAEDVEIGGQSYHASASIGIALPLRGGQAGHDLLREADTAMYHAKVGGRNGVTLFETAMLAEAERKLTLERDLAQAMENGELSMHLQLQIDHRHVPVGAELLMRWRRADGTPVSPELFIPAAESSGLIVPLGHWVLRQACAYWLRLEQAGHPLPLSVNVSPLQFRQPDFVDQVRAILHETGAPAGQLIFEVTEGLLVNDLNDTIARMHELAQMGIRFSIDDFGTGYSNLAYLKKMPLYELKIDKSFIRDTPGDPNGTAIVQSILAMADHLGLRVVAEGVETAQQADFLAANRKPAMQGFLFSRPAPLDDFIAQIRGWQAQAEPETRTLAAA
ncbi:putative bifunctional diguanylate cyclase/phosphodiesterase [Massilia sp. LXY-6]|uniref:putative bifunctional diguanylate cyclase/phosphodiesterase n=1 Tax=Massilia sp. LXY-6 TaxID=3379823 RepID=UPI003EE28496